MNIKLAELDDLKTVTEILDKATLDLHRKGINQWEYPWDPEKVKEDIKRSNIYVLSLDDEVAGTFGIKDIDSLNEFPVTKGSKYLYQIAVPPEYQGKNLGAFLTEFACSHSRDMRKPYIWTAGQVMRS